MVRIGHFFLLTGSTTRLSTFDSLSGVNDESALKIVEGLNIPVNNFFPVHCFQQTNGYECGINGLVHAKLVLHYYYCHSVKEPFLEWFYNDLGH